MFAACRASVLAIVDARSRSQLSWYCAVKRSICPGESGLPEDIALAAVFLASDESSFINGHDLVVDGAMTGGRNWSQQQQGYVALKKAFDQGAG